MLSAYGVPDGPSIPTVHECGDWSLTIRQFGAGLNGASHWFSWPYLRSNSHENDSRQLGQSPADFLSRHSRIASGLDFEQVGSPTRINLEITIS